MPVGRAPPPSVQPLWRTPKAVLAGRLDGGLGGRSPPVPAGRRAPGLPPPPIVREGRPRRAARAGRGSRRPAPLRGSPARRSQRRPVARGNRRVLRAGQR